MNKLLLVVSLLILLIAMSAIPAFAQSCGTSQVYFDPVNGKNSNNGTRAFPMQDAGAAVQAGKNSGKSGCAYEIKADGTLGRVIPYEAYVPNTGLPLPLPIFYALLATLAAALIVVGLRLQRRSQILSLPQ